MKTLNNRIKVYGGLATAGLCALSVSAQLPGAGGAGTMNAALTKLFGETKAFSAKADVRVLDSATNEIASMPMGFAMRDEQVRVEIDMLQMKNKDMPPGASAQLKQMGMAQVVSLIRPDKKMVYVLYPESKVLMTMPLSPEDADSAKKPPKLQKTELGKETIDGHPCVKNKVLIQQDTGPGVEATTWNASDMKDFPLQIQTKEQGNISFIHFKDVQFATPDAKLFEPPADFTEYKDPQAMMQGIMKKMAEGSEKK